MWDVVCWGFAGILSFVCLAKLGQIQLFISKKTAYNFRATQVFILTSRFAEQSGAYRILYLPVIQNKRPGIAVNTVNFK
jgi:hypothetical protein